MTDTYKYMSWFWQQLRSEVYTLRCVSAADERCTMSTHYTIAQFMKAEKFLKHKNANGDHIYGRPDSTKYILVDDLNEQGLRWLRDDGLTPVLVVATSAGNFQAWVKVSDKELSIPLATAAAKLLAIRYEGDECSADALHLGRIPGFTNRKAKYRDERDRYFWTWANIPSHGIAPAAASLLADAKAHAFPVSTSGGVILPSTGATRYDDTHREAVNILADEFQWTDELRGDRSKVDYYVASHLLRRGFKETDVIDVILCGSAKAKEKGMTNGVRYAVMTVKKAASNSSVSTET